MNLNTMNKTNLMKVLAITFLAIFAFSGCSSKKNSSIEGTEGMTEAELNAQREARFGSGSIPMAEGDGLFKDVHFDYDSSQVKDLSRSDVEYNADVLRKNSNIKVQLEGHCDERGTAEYNLALGADRSKSVRDMLIGLGVPNTQIDTISYGEEVPLDTGHDEVAYAKNRRVHFSGFSGK